MPTRCIVAGCGNTNKEGTSLHRFPKDEKLRKLWTSRVKLTRAKWQGPSDNSVICSEHFDESDFEDEGLWSDFGLKRLKKLKPDAIPKIKSKLEKSSTEGKGRKKSRPGIEKRKKMKVSAMDGPSESQNSSPSVIYLHDVHTSDVWMQQRNIFFEQRQHHDSEILGDVSKRDGEFVFHLLEVHAKFCLKPNSCQPIGGDDDIQKSNVTGLQVSTSVMIAAPSTSSTSDFVEKTSITSMTYIDQETGLAFPNPSQETTGGWIPEQPHANWESPDMSHDLTAVSLSRAIKLEKEDDVPEEETTGVWIPEQPHVNWESPDMSHDLTAVGLSRAIKLEKEDDVPEDASIDAPGVGLHNWIPEQPVVKFELPGTSHDHQMTVITAVVKSEEEDEANEDASIDALGAALQNWIPEQPVVNFELHGTSHDHQMTVITAVVKSEEQDGANEGLIGELVEGETKTKRARIVSTKLDLRELPSECRSCHKVLEDSRHGNSLLKCDACMKEESCADQQTEQVISPEAASPRRDSAHDPLDSESRNTKRQLKFSLKVFQDYCNAARNINFDEISDMDLKALDQLLGKFYAGVKSRDGESYSKKSLQALRYGLQRHFLNLRDIDIIKNTNFAKSGRVFKTVLRKLKEEGKASVKHHNPVSETDMNKIQDSLDHDSPCGLQRKVFIDIMTHFANRGEENLHDMKADDFILSEQNGRSYFRMVDKATKNHPDNDLNSQGGRMFEIPGSSRCPVATLLKYKSKLNPKLPYLWQKPKKAARDDGPWYDNVRVGIHTLGTMTKTISNEAGCLTKYTNHCLRAMSITTLDHAGFPSRDIMTVSGHRSETSIKHYAQSSDQQKMKMSDTISSALGLQEGPADHGQLEQVKRLLAETDNSTIGGSNSSEHPV